ncbi:MAG: UvrD-helicase domain-containing protein [Clostridia bacterium]|nr:UvrD-helicase domain-containing protein [Clostridia bacterium]
MPTNTNNEKLTFTPMQEKAINHVHGNALVSASAGSGKTRVVIERILNLIENHGVSLENVLAVTFTKAAAEEMKDKLKTRLTKKYALTGDQRLKEQLSLVQGADVSTIHSFCSKLLRRFFYLTELDGKFEVIDELRADVLKQTAMEQTFEELYEQKDQDFFDLVTVFGKKRKDFELRLLVAKLYVFCIEEGGVNVVLEKTLKNYENPNKSLNIMIYESVIGTLKWVKTALENALPLLSEDVKRKEFCAQLITLVKGVISTKSVNDFGAYALIVEPLKAPGGKIINEKASNVLKTSLKTIKTSLINAVEQVTNANSNEDLSGSKDLCVKLLNLTEKFSKTYANLKREENALDFNDLEQFTLELLQNPEVKEEVKNTYKYVFIDEYQDVNNVQEKIMLALQNDNLFMVGDSKQSIYAFRGCNPKHFVNKYYNYLNGAGTPISLDNNFRSAKKIIQTVNAIFSEVMSLDFGGTDYKTSPMIYGERYQGYEGESELHIVQTTKKVKEKLLEDRGVYSVIDSNLRTPSDNRVPEAQLVLNLVRENLGKDYYDPDEKKVKKVGFGDVCILLRGMTNKLASQIVEELTKASVPVSSTVEVKIQDYPEIKLLLNLLSLLVCADRDVPLATVMKTLFKFTPNELAEIRYRVSSGRKSFYECVLSAKNYSDNVGKKVALFLEWLDKKRLIAEFSGVGEVISQIIKETGYYAEIMASPFGSVKIKRIERFLAESVLGDKKFRAHEFEAHIKDTMSNLAISEATDDDTVKVMTMHASKGLEFPVVIVAGANAQFSSKDLSGSVIYSRDYGIAVQSFNVENMTVKENSARMVIKESVRRSTAVEELRLFYVALTRAKYKLIVTGTSNDYNGNVLDYKYDVKNYLGFIPNGAINTYYHTDLELLSSEVNDKETSVAGSDVDSELVSIIKGGLTYVYPHENAVNLPVKRSVSAVRASEDDEHYKTTAIYGDASAEKGTAYHRFLELIDFYSFNLGDKQALLDSGKLTLEQFNAVDENKVKSILSLSIFDKIKGYKLYKERKFFMLVPANELGLSTSTEEVLIQGIIDLLAVKDNEAILIDYKLSTIESDSDLKKKYLTQMELYKMAIEKVLKLKVTTVCILNVLKESEIFV